jgi:hypothetical protein
MTPTRAVSLALLGVFCVAMDARALVVCRTKSDAVSVRDACRKKETAVALADVGLPGAQGTPGAPGATGRAALDLLDAQGTEVGPVVYAESDPFGNVPGPYVFAVVQKPALGGAALLSAGFEGQAVGEVFYAAADCAGAALAAGKTFIPVLQVIGDTVFRPVADAGATSVASTETGDQSMGCTSITARGGCCRTIPPGVRSDLSTTTTFTPLGFTPPFHVGP